MGCSQSNQYYLGFINISISHMDIFSFILGILLTVATMYIIRCAKANKKVHRHILGRGKTGTTFYNGQSWAPPYPMSPEHANYFMPDDAYATTRLLGKNKLFM